MTHNGGLHVPVMAASNSKRSSFSWVYRTSSKQSYKKLPADGLGSNLDYTDKKLTPPELSRNKQTRTHTRTHTHTHPHTHTCTHSHAYIHTHEHTHIHIHIHIHTHAHTDTHAHTHTDSKSKTMFSCFMCDNRENPPWDLRPHASMFQMRNPCYIGMRHTICTVKLLDSPQLLRTCSNVSGGARLQAYLWAASNPRPRYRSHNMCKTMPGCWPKAC